MNLVPSTNRVSASWTVPEQPDDFAHRAPAVSVGHSRCQNGGYPTGSTIVDALLKDADSAIAGMRDPEKIRNLLRLDRQFLSCLRAGGEPWRLTPNARPSSG